MLVAALALSAIAYIIAHRGTSVGAEIVTASGLKYVDIVQGDGASPRLGQTVVVNYTGTLENGTKFGDGRSSEFRLGEVIPGWNEGIQSMKVGGKRKLIVPAPLGYGAQGRPPSIPPNSTLIFEVELLGIK